jgi:L-ascorbate metabolism protein UlaG (beta-lactamase superfamily)
MQNGDHMTFQGVEVEALPAYNIAHTRPDGKPFHPKGNGNGYLLTVGDTRILVAGDTENIPEIKELKGIDVAFLPMNLPYTMDPEMVADVALAMRPRILYPYHFGNTDPQELVKLLQGAGDIEVRVRELQ